MSPDEEEARWRKVEQTLEGHVQEIGTLRLYCKRLENEVQVLRADLDASVKRIEAYQVTINERLEALEDPEEGPDYDDADDDERDQPEGTARTITINLNIK